MAKRISRHVRSILIILIIPFATYCSKAPQSDDGGQHTGGGFVGYSTQDEVNAALDKALRLAAEPDPEKNIFAQFWNSWGRDSQFDFIKRPSHIFPVIDGPGDGSIDLVKNANLFESPPLVALSKNKITRLISGNCLDSKYVAHNDASVSSFSTNAEMCISVGNLTRLPPSSLLRETLSLLLHEAGHMGGAEEPEALAWQQEFSAYFGLRFGEIETDEVTADTLRQLGEAKILITRVQTTALLNPKNPTIFSHMGELVEQLARLPYYSDALALELKTNALKPNLINNYSYSVFVLMQNIRLRFVIKSDFVRVKGIRAQLEFLPDDQVGQALSDIAKDIAQVEENFLAFLGGSSHARSVCVKPDLAGDLNRFPVRPPGQDTPDTNQNHCVNDI